MLVPGAWAERTTSRLLEVAWSAGERRERRCRTTAGRKGAAAAKEQETEGSAKLGASRSRVVARGLR